MVKKNIVRNGSLWSGIIFENDKVWQGRFCFHYYLASCCYAWGCMYSCDTHGRQISRGFFFITVINIFNCNLNLLSKVYPPPVLPKDFRPFHIMKASSKENQPPTTDYQSRFKLSATQRGAMLGEEELPGKKLCVSYTSYNGVCRILF